MFVYEYLESPWSCTTYAYFKRFHGKFTSKSVNEIIQSTVCLLSDTNLMMLAENRLTTEHADYMYIMEGMQE